MTASVLPLRAVPQEWKFVQLSPVFGPGMCVRGCAILVHSEGGRENDRHREKYPQYVIVFWVGI